MSGFRNKSPADPLLFKKPLRWREFCHLNADHVVCRTTNSSFNKIKAVMLNEWPSLQGFRQKTASLSVGRTWRCIIAFSVIPYKIDEAKVFICHSFCFLCIPVYTENDSNNPGINVLAMRIFHFFGYQTFHSKKIRLCKLLVNTYH